MCHPLALIAASRPLGALWRPTRAGPSDPSRPEKRAPAANEATKDSEQYSGALEAARKRMDEYKKVREEHLLRKIERTREYSRKNIEQAKALRLRNESNKA